jgi:foldase protein PrsA
MTPKLRQLAAAGAVLACAGALTACGDSVPGNAVAQVGDQPIKRDTFDHWMTIAAIAQSGGGQPGAPTPKVSVPKPPEFTECVAAKKKAAPKPAKGQPRQDDAQLKTQCKTEYESLRDQVLGFLIQTKWIAYEAAEQNVKVKDSDVFATFQQQKQQSFPSDKDYQQFLKSSGYAEEDLLYRIRIDDLQTKLREKVTKGTDKVSDKELQAYYDKNKARFATPERRDLRIVLTKTEDRANQARKAIASGQSFSAVAKRFSIDQASKQQGGVLLAVAKGQQEKALDEAVFKAKKGELQGPVKTQFGYYVFQVQKVTPADQQSLEDSKETIKSLLVAEKQQKAVDGFVKGFTDQWTDETNCRKEFEVPQCKGAPKPKTDTTTTPAPQPQS